MADAYSGHHRLFADGHMTPAACMAHARRKFEEALEAGELIASQALDIFSLLYRIDRETADLTADQRLRRRQAEVIPILDRLETRIIAWEADQRRSSGLFGAAQYTRKIFQNLRTYTTDAGRISLPVWVDHGADRLRRAVPCLLPGRPADCSHGPSAGPKASAPTESTIGNAGCAAWMRPRRHRRSHPPSSRFSPCRRPACAV